MDDFTMDDECQLCSRRISKLVFSRLTYRHHPLLDLTANSASSISPSSDVRV
jgi:hypothetical protein